MEKVFELLRFLEVTVCVNGCAREMLRTSNTIRILEVPEDKNAEFCSKLLQRPDMNSETEEVLLSGHGLEALCSFSRFKCLGALWLNDNKLRKVEGLNSNVQIKALYLHNNQLVTLKGSIKHLRHIQTLTLYNNRLQDLASTLPLIEHLVHLDTLDMSGNPLANEFNYRLRVIHAIPSLQVLDRHQITEGERMQAEKLFQGSKASSISFMKRKPIWKNPPAQPIASLSTLTKEMYHEIAATTKVKEAEAREKELSAFQTTQQLPTQQVPVATAVEQVTTKSKTLQDVLAQSDLELGLTSTAGLADTAQSGNLNATGNLKSRVAGPQKDFVKTKRFVESRERPLGAQSQAVGGLSREATHMGRTTSTQAMLSQSGPGAVALDTEKYAEYERNKRMGRVITALEDHTVKL